MTAFTVMTWNVQNFFLAAHESGPDTHAQFRAKLSSLSRTIDIIKPDLLALQEVGSLNALCSLKSALRHRMSYSLLGYPDQRGIRVALLSTSRFHDDSIHHFRAFPEKITPVQAKDPAFDDPTTPQNESTLDEMGRGALQATITIDDKPLTIITAHFKSKLINYARQRGVVEGSRFRPNDEGERNRYAAYALNRRTGEALTVRDQLNKLLDDPDNPTGSGREKAVIFCGDLNDTVDAATTQIIQGPSGSEIETGGFGRPDQGDGYRLWNLAPLLPDIAGEPAYTRKYKGRGELIDHIFATRALVDPERLPVADTIMSPDPLPSIDDDPSARRNKPGSDHAAVFATFNF